MCTARKQKNQLPNTPEVTVADHNGDATAGRLSGQGQLAPPRPPIEHTRRNMSCSKHPSSSRSSSSNSTAR